MAKSQADDLLTLLRANHASAKRLGWQPADFGASAWDSDLLRAVQDFQAQRLLPTTGVVDDRTMRALQGYREGLLDKAERQPREDSLRGLGSVTRYDPADTRVVRSRPFTGTVLLALDGQPVDAQVAAQVDAIGVPLAALCRTVVASHQRLLAVYDLWTVPGGPGPLDDCADAQATAHACGTILARLLADHHPQVAGLVVVIGLQAWARIVADATLAAAFMVGLRAVTDLPAAVCLGLRHRGAPLAAKRAWSVLGPLFDAAMPPVPGVYAGEPIEHACGTMVATWAAYGKVRPNWQVPVYVPHAGTTDNEVHRYRDWLLSRGFRGRAWAGDMAQVAAFLGDLPATIVRVDD
jgi:hypothetical protein